MSLYYESAPLVLSKPDEKLGSLKSRVFGLKTLKSSPAQVYALVVEAFKWSFVLKEVIENSQLLTFERKLSPALALLLVHDFLLAKAGIAAPASHPLRLAIIRHKARLHAELTKARIKRGFSSLDDLRKDLNRTTNRHLAVHDKNLSARIFDNGVLSEEWSHPRWVRINTLRTNLEEQLRTTFSGYKKLDTIDMVVRKRPDSVSEDFLFIDENIPNLLALPALSDIQKSSAYLNGMIILQDKASCFPAYLLNPSPGDGDVLDACAAPGNKTTHLAAIMQTKSPSNLNSKILACERDRDRGTALQNLITKAGAQGFTIIKPGQDFLKIKPQESPWNAVHSLLLDPSCSGSGIIGRDEAPIFALPQSQPNEMPNRRSRKRKRGVEPGAKLGEEQLKNGTENKSEDHKINLNARLAALSTFQLNLLLHAFSFPLARKITYSTCSVHPEENEYVVLKALSSPLAHTRNWQILQRDEQISGARNWTIRGDLNACRESLLSCGGDDRCGAQEIAEACIRCEMGTKDGTQGFFVAAFVREDEPRDELGGLAHGDLVSNDGTELEWEGFSDEEVGVHDS